MDIKTHDTIIKKSAAGTFILIGFAGIQYVIVFVTQIILARLLIPEYFGMIAFAIMVVMFINNFCRTHGERFIIKEKKNIQEKIDNIFTIELALSIFFIGFVFLLAPAIMKLLNKPDLTVMVQVLAITFLYNPFSKPKYLFEKELNFKMANLPSIISQAIGSIIAITMALLGFGIWSLIFLLLSKQISESILIWIIAPYRPRLRFNKIIVKQILNYGLPLFGSTVLVFFYLNIDYYIVGQLLGLEQLGFYYLGFTMSNYLLQINYKINSVAFPAFSKIEDKTYIKKGFKLLTRTTAIIYLLPTLLILVLGRPLIEIVFGEKWLPATIPLQIFMVLTSLKAIVSYWDPIILLKGKTKIFLWITCYRAPLTAVAVYILTLRFGIIGASMGTLIAYAIVVPLMARWVGKIFHLEYSFLHKPIMVFILLYALFYVLIYFLKPVGVSAIIMAILITGSYVLIWIKDPSIKKAYTLIKRKS